MPKWLVPLIRRLLGQLSPEAVIAEADEPIGYLRSERVCEAHFSSGEFALRQGRKDEAVRALTGMSSGSRGPRGKQSDFVVDLRCFSIVAPAQHGVVKMPWECIFATLTVPRQANIVRKFSGI